MADQADEAAAEPVGGTLHSQPEPTFFPSLQQTGIFGSSHIQGSLMEDNDESVDESSIALFDSTHPSSFSNLSPHADSLASFQQDLLTALSEGLAEPLRYTAVHVLLLRWQGVEEKLGIEDEVKGLDRVFSERFKFKTERFIIPEEDAQWELVDRLSRFRKKHKDPRNLFIICYNGHGSFDQHDACWLHPTMGSSINDGVSMPWNPIQSVLEALPQDVLFILDCCHAGAAAIRKGSGPVKELLAACGRETYAPAGAGSFSNCLITALWRTKGPSVPISRLYAEILGSKEELQRTPIHVFLNDHPKSIVLPLPPENLEVPEIDLSDATGSDINAEASDSTASSQSSSLLEGLNLSTGKTSLTSLSSTAYRVVLAIKLSEDVKPSLAAWTQWLYQSPPEMIALADVKFEALHKSDSTLLIVSLPVELWVLLPRHPAYRFIDFVKSENLLLHQSPIFSNFAKLGAILMAVAGNIIMMIVRIFWRGFVITIFNLGLRSGRKIWEISNSCIRFATRSVTSLYNSLCLTWKGVTSSIFNAWDTLSSYLPVYDPKLGPFKSIWNWTTKPFARLRWGYLALVFACSLLGVVFVAVQYRQNTFQQSYDKRWAYVCVSVLFLSIGFYLARMFQDALRERTSIYRGSYRQDASTPSFDLNAYLSSDRSSMLRPDDSIFDPVSLLSPGDLGIELESFGPPSYPYSSSFWEPSRTTSTEFDFPDLQQTGPDLSEERPVAARESRRERRGVARRDSRSEPPPTVGDSLHEPD